MSVLTTETKTACNSKTHKTLFGVKQCHKPHKMSIEEKLKHLYISKKKSDFFRNKYHLIKICKIMSQ